MNSEQSNIRMTNDEQSNNEWKLSCLPFGSNVRSSVDRQSNVVVRTHKYAKSIKVKPNTMRFFYTLFFLSLIVLSSAASAAPLEKISEKVIPQSADGVAAKLIVRASSAEISVADSLELSIQVVEPAGTEASFPGFDELGFATDFSERSQRFRVTDISELRREEQADGSTLISQTYTLEPWLSGDYAILPIMVIFHERKSTENPSAQGSQKTVALEPEPWRAPILSLMTDGIRVKVTPLPADRSSLSDLLGQVDLEQATLLEKERRTENKSDEELRREEEEKNEAAAALKDRRFPWWVIWGLLAIMAVVPLVWYLGRKKIKTFFAKKTVPPHVLALQSLDELRKKDLLSSGKVKEFYYELSYILRRYIGRRFHIFADKQTTEEFFAQLLLNNPFDKMAEQILRDFAESADTVKYSLFRPDSKLGNDSFQIVRSFIDNTKPSAEEGK